MSAIIDVDALKKNCFDCITCLWRDSRSDAAHRFCPQWVRHNRQANGGNLYNIQPTRVRVLCIGTADGKPCAQKNTVRADTKSGRCAVCASRSRTDSNRNKAYKIANRIAANAVRRAVRQVA